MYWRTLPATAHTATPYRGVPVPATAAACHDLETSTTVDLSQPVVPWPALGFDGVDGKDDAVPYEKGQIFPHLQVRDGLDTLGPLALHIVPHAEAEIEPKDEQHQDVEPPAEAEAGARRGGGGRERSVAACERRSEPQPYQIIRRRIKARALRLCEAAKDLGSDREQTGRLAQAAVLER